MNQLIFTKSNVSKVFFRWNTKFSCGKELLVAIDRVDTEVFFFPLCKIECRETWGREWQRRRDNVCFTNFGKLNLPTVVQFKARGFFWFVPAASIDEVHFKSGQNWLENNHLTTKDLNSWNSPLKQRDRKTEREKVRNRAKVIQGVFFILACLTCS